jgi:hypothetical protein
MSPSPVRLTTLLLTLVACGPDPPGAGPIPADAASERATPPVATQDLVRVRVGDRRRVFEGPAQVKPKCFGGHKGFEASAGGDTLTLNAFLFEPGAYACDQAMPFVFLFWRGSEGPAEYEASPVEPTGSTCALTVTSVQPRLRATFAALLNRTAEQGPDQVSLSEGELDVAMPPICP